MIDVKHAVFEAKRQVADLLERSEWTRITLEEVALSEEEDRWIITLGIYRPQPEDPMAGILPGIPPKPDRVDYKRVILSADDGRFISLRNRTDVA